MSPALVLFLSITCAQFGLARCARSNTLLVDCASMLVDSATAAGNLWAVCRETNDPEDAARGALVTSASLFWCRGHHGGGAGAVK